MSNIPGIIVRAAAEIVKSTVIMRDGAEPASAQYQVRIFKVPT
jgi:hypothetical protein